MDDQTIVKENRVERQKMKSENKVDMKSPTKPRREANKFILQEQSFSQLCSSSKLRTRKEVPAFRKVELDDNDCDRIVGKRVKVYWSGSRKWFAGRIRGFNSEKELHFILYDDGDKEELDLKKEQFELEVLPAEGFKLRAKSFLKMKSTDSDGEKSISGLLKKETDTTSCSELEENSYDAEERQNNVNDCISDVPIAEFKTQGFSKKRRRQAARQTVQEDSSSPRRSSSKLLPKTEVPSFRKVNIDESDWERIVGKRIKVYWSGSRKWFTGRITGFDGNKRLHSILYEDGDKEELDLKNEKFKLEIRIAEGFKLQAAAPLSKMMSVDGNESIIGPSKEESDIADGIDATEISQNIIKDCSTDTTVANYMKTHVSSKRHVLRPRKVAPVFQMIDLEDSDCDRIVGKRVKVFWPLSRKWFTGRIKSFDARKRLHFILYDDGDKEELDLKKEKFELEILADEGFKLRSEPYYSRRKSRSWDSVKRISGMMGEPDGTETEMNKRERDDKELVRADLISQPSNLSKLRPRREMPSFRKVNLDENDNDRIVGKRVKVYWSGSRKWFTGRIRGFDGKKTLHSILYDDGDKEDLDLRKELFELEILPTDGFKLSTEPNRRIKSTGIDSVKRSSDVINENSGSEKEMRNYDPKKEKQVTKPLRSTKQSEQKDNRSFTAENFGSKVIDVSSSEESEYTGEYFSTDVLVSKSTKNNFSSEKNRLRRFGKRRSFNAEDVVVFQQVNANAKEHNMSRRDEAHAARKNISMGVYIISDKVEEKVVKLEKSDNGEKPDVTDVCACSKPAHYKKDEEELISGQINSHWPRGNRYKQMQSILEAEIGSNYEVGVDMQGPSSTTNLEGCQDASKKKLNIVNAKCEKVLKDAYERVWPEINQRKECKRRRWS